MSYIEWQKSSFSSGNPDSNCLEVASDHGGIRHLRESDDPATVLTTTPTRLATLLAHLRSAGDSQCVVCLAAL